MKLSLATLAFASVLSVAACAAPASEDAESATADLVAITTLGELTPSELETAAKKNLSARFALLTAAHPDVRELTLSNISDFVERKIQHDGWSTNDVDHDFADMFRTLLRFHGTASIPVASLEAKFAAWLPSQVPAATLASGKVACDQASSRLLASACGQAQRAKSIADAKTPSGLDMGTFIADWQASEEGRVGVRMKNPVALTGEPGVVEVKRLAGVSEGCRQRAWGNEAVDMYLEHKSDALKAHADALKGSGFKKRWYWACGGGSWGEEGFALLDEHNQLWSFGEYSAE